MLVSVSICIDTVFALKLIYFGSWLAILIGETLLFVIKSLLFILDIFMLNKNIEI